jgi:peptidoglycan/LPS O-acetylase OafA/YrhL
MAKHSMTHATAFRSEPADQALRRASRSNFRLDIQALRAVAVAGVVLYHLWPHHLSGGFVGVDVFFVISGFLITSHLVNRPPRRLTDLFDFWARRIRRLLPASLLVLTFTAVASYFLGATSAWQDTGRQIVASALYVQNWVLASDSVDYLASKNAPTAVQHFWSLSVEEQFYFVWPIIIGLLVAFGAKSKLRPFHILLVGVGGVTVASLVASIWYSTHDPASAYFVTPTRIWELAAGGIVAILFNRPSARVSNASAALSWTGCIGILASFLAINGSMAFPGYVALLPVVSTCLVIGAHSQSRLSPHFLMRIRPAQFIGNTSYSIYLWHWPLLIILPSVLGTLRWWHKFGLIAAVLFISALSMKWVENRFRRAATFSTYSRTFITALLMMTVAATSGVGLQHAAHAKERASQTALERAFSDNSPCLGARSITASKDDPEACPKTSKLLLDPASAKTDKPDAYADDCWAQAPFTGERPVCHYGDGDTRIALVGNSHAGHWLPALQELADDNNWSIDTYLVDTCNPTDATIDLESKEDAKGCKAYGEWAKKKTIAGEYDAIITSNRQVSPIQGFDLDHTIPAATVGYKTFLEDWDKSGTPVIVLRDTPFPSRAGINVPDCIAKSGVDSCAGTTQTWHSIDPMAKAANSLGLSSQSVIDPTSEFCPDDVCPAAIGGVIVYFDGSHMTATYSKTLAPWLKEQLEHVPNANIIK